MDGDTSQIIGRNDFPQAQMISLVENANPDEMLMNVASNKADVAFVEPLFFLRFNKTNPELLKQVPVLHPLRVYGNVFFLAQGEDKLREMLNTALTEQFLSGAVENIIRRYEAVPGTILRVTSPYVSAAISR